MVSIGLLVLAAVPLALVVLTGIGAHRRGLTIPRSVLVGLFFPVAWAVWYVRDERPYQRTNRHAV